MKKNFRFDTRHIRNNLELINGLNKPKIKSDDKLIFLDVTNMFGKIPKIPLLELLTATMGIPMGWNMLR